MAGRFRRRGARRTVLVVALAVFVDPIGAVQAQNVPSGHDAEHAREAQEGAGEVVAEAEARLATLNAELDQARVRAATAVEAYNGARAELSLAGETEDAAVAEAAEIHGERTTAEIELGRLAAAAYRSGGGWSELAVVANIVTDASIVDVPGTLTTVARSQGAVHARWSAALDEAQSAVREAERHVAERAVAERAAEEALKRAEQSVAAHEEAVERAEDKRDVLLTQLAEARGTTAELERERERADEERLQAERKQAERHRSERERAEREQEERSQRDQRSEPDRAEQAREDGAVPSAGAEPTPPELAEPDDAAEPVDDRPGPTTSFASSSAAGRAIDYARAQLGKPYIWAGAGPEGFDCSGLTKRAWERAGVQLTHWSVAQARQTVAVSYSDLRPGDLIFWSSDGAPSGTYHVALYIGGGEMIHAPSPGGHVEIRNVFYWRTPSFYTRVVA